MPDSAKVKTNYYGPIVNLNRNTTIVRPKRMSGDSAIIKEMLFDRPTSPSLKIFTLPTIPQINATAKSVRNIGPNSSEVIMPNGSKSIHTPITQNIYIA